MSTNSPKTIKIFLLTGKPTGIKTVEISGWTGKGFVIPRNDLQEALNRDDLKAPCVYFLAGENEEGEIVVYVGESENFIERIQYHHRDKSKDFWNTVICFISKDETLNKAYVKYLESLLYGDIKKAGRVIVEGGKNSNPARLSESDMADADDFAKNIRTLLPVVGFPFLKDPVESEKREIFYCQGPDADTKGMPTSEGFVVLKGSTVRGSEAPALPEYVKQLRRKILGVEVIDKEEKHTLEDDQVFSSPSTAAAFALGRNANGWTEWKNKDGKTLDEVKRRQ